MITDNDGGAFTLDSRLEAESFSLGRFHDRLLAYGAIPVPLIAQLM